MRQRVKYSIGGSPTLDVKRTANAVRDMPATLAVARTLQRRAGAACSAEIAARIRSSARGEQPAGPSGAAIGQMEPERLDEHQMVAG